MYIISGKVIKGDGYGKKIGFPTINLSRRNFLSLKKKPTFGIYAGEVTMSNTRCLTYKAGIVIGPLDKGGRPKIEAHLLGYGGKVSDYSDYRGKAYGVKVYGVKAVFEIHKFIRKFKKFRTEKELVTQIEKDLRICSQA